MGWDVLGKNLGSEGDGIKNDEGENERVFNEKAQERGEDQESDPEPWRTAQGIPSQNTDEHETGEIPVDEPETGKIPIDEPETGEIPIDGIETRKGVEHVTS